MKVHCGWLLMAVAVSFGCGKAERNEAVTLCKVLEQSRADFATANSQEKDLLGGVRAWAEGIIANGGGRPAELEQNANVAKDLSNSAAGIGTRLGQVREALSNLALHEEYLQGIRTDLINKIARRQRLLQEVRVALQDTAAGFDGFRQSRAYTGDTYPGGIDKLNSLVQGYKEPDDSVAQAAAGLRTKYKITNADLGS